MNLFLVTQWFPPEQAPIGYMIRELAGALVRHGWEVTVVTGFPNHPGGVVFEGYSKRWFQEEMIDGIHVWRVYSMTSPNRTRWNRILTFVSFTMTSFWAILRRGRPDLIFAVFQPLSVGLVLPLVAKLKGARLVLNVQDLHPDVPIELGLVKNPVLIRCLRALEAYGYGVADGIAVICEGFRQHCIAKGAAARKLAVIENWVDLDEIRPGERNNSFRRQAGCSESDFVVLYAGTVGLVSGAEVMIGAAHQLRGERDIKFLFVGEGPLVAQLQKAASVRSLPNVIFMPFQDRSRLNEVQASADVSVVSMSENKGRTSVPSKVLAYMAAARPVIASVDADSETARLVLMANCGVQVPAEDPAALAQAIVALKLEPAEAGQLGRNGRGYLEANLSKAKVTDKYIRMFRSVMGA